LRLSILQLLASGRVDFGRKKRFGFPLPRAGASKAFDHALRPNGRFHKQPAGRQGFKTRRPAASNPLKKLAIFVIHRTMRSA